ncbi:MAG: ATP:cob(I)alamin adenosyltransferase [Rickettsiales bacterium]|jgi:cob(I)alamin adenosyltransferase|nr:ATP:cob(I)alamin adenosyltransferase [Rickettsiales bacterium]
MAKVTTKLGDNGMTQVAPDAMAPKSATVLDVMGNIDELSCVLGLCGDKFDAIQSFLSEIMGYLYYKNNNEARISGQVMLMEEYVSSHNNSIPTWFVNPRGFVSLARAVCRRAERSVVRMNNELRESSETEYNLYPIMKYLNRLSDYLFVKSFEREVNMPELFPDELAAQTDKKMRMFM